MSESGSPRKSTFLVLLQPLGGVIGALIAFGVLTVATRQGQFASIASFGAGAGVAALASVAVGGGTTIAYTTGTTKRQRAVRVVRNTIVLPAILIATALAVWLYSVLGHLEPLGVLAGGLSTSAGVGAELDSSYLRRHLMTGRLLVVDILNRLIAFGFIVGGIPFAFAMLAGAVARASLLKWLTRTDPSREAGLQISRSVLALAYEPKLTSLSILYSICDRLGALAAPATAPIPVAGGFTAVLSAQQSVSGVLMSGLQTTLATRSQLRSRLSWADHLDLFFVAVALAGAALMIAWREPLIGFLALDTTSNPDAYWNLIALLIPASIASRVLDFRFLTESEPRNAVISRGMATCVAVGFAATAVVNSRIAVLASGLLIAEGTAVLVSFGLMGMKHFRLRKGQGRG